MTNLIPMAGEGKRFRVEGYEIPKPLIEVSEEPMILKAIKSMPESDRWVFVCRKEHIENYKIDKILRKEIPSAEIIEVNRTTDGQLSTCLLARKLLNENEELFIGACDNSMIWNKKKWEKLKKDKSIDAIIWTFTKQANLLINPRAWGWVVVDEKNIVKEVSVKTPISNNPFGDQAVIGAFWFKNAKTFIEAAEELIKNDLRINNEFYVDSVPNIMIKNKKKVATFVVDLYIGFGTPNDLKTYQYWDGYFKKSKNRRPQQ